MGLRELSTILWEERQLLDLLLFKLEEESMVLSSGRHRWLARASSEVEFVLERIREIEASREAEAAQVAREYAIEGVPSLAAIAEVSPEPWAGTLREHRRAFQSMMARIQEVSNQNREVLAKYVLAVSDALAIVNTADTARYGPDGAPAGPRLATALLDASA